MSWDSSSDGIEQTNCTIQSAETGAQGARKRMEQGKTLSFFRKLY